MQVRYDGGDCQQESSRYFSHSLSEIARMALAPALPAAAMAVRGRGWVELEGKSQVEGPVGGFLNYSSIGSVQRRNC